jgi:hypothetical protein
MSRRLSQDIKVDIAIAPVQATSSVTSKYFKLNKEDRALFVWSITPVGASAVVSTSIGTIYQAKNASAESSAAALASSTAIISIGTKVTEFTITPQVASAADTVSITGYDINGDAKTALTFTAENGGTAAHTASSSRYFSINDTASGSGLISNICTNLAAIMNDTTWGVPGLYASASSTNVTCVAIEPGENMFTLTSSTTTNLTMATTKIMGMCEVNASSLTLSSDFTHVALNINNQISAWTSAIIIRGGRKNHMPIQMVGALTTVGE